MMSYVRLIVVATMMLTAACTSLPDQNPSRLGAAGQDSAVDALKQMELIFHGCSTLRLEVVKIELTDSPDEEERWSVLSCTGEEHSYLLKRNQDSTITIRDQNGKGITFR